MMSCIQKMLLLLSAFCYGCVEAMEKPKESGADRVTVPSPDRIGTCDNNESVSDKELNLINSVLYQYNCGAKLEKSDNSILVVLKTNTGENSEEKRVPFDESFFNAHEDLTYEVLRYAIGLSCYSVVDYCAQAGYNLDKTIGNSLTFLVSLIEPVIHGQLDIKVVENLLKNGANPNKVSWKGSPIRVVLQATNTRSQKICASLLNLLLENGADPNLSELKDAELEGRSVRSELLKTTTPLKIAVKNNLPEMAEILLDFGADPNREDKDGNTPMILATRAGNMKMLKMFLDRKAAPDKKNKNGVTPLVAAFEAGDYHLNGQLVDIVQLLLKSGANPNQKIVRWKRKIPLLEEANTEVAKLLLKFGADPNEKVELIPPTMEDAIDDEKAELAIDLFKKGKVILNYDGRNISPLEYAICKGKSKMVKAFVENGIDPNSPGSENMPPVFYAIEEDNLEMIPVLISCGANINGKMVDADGESVTPFEYAVKKFCPKRKVEDFGSVARIEEIKKVVDIFSKNGIDLNANCCQNMPPIFYAIKDNRAEIIPVLIKHGADVNKKMTDAKGRVVTTIEYAIDMDNIDAICSLMENGVTFDTCGYEDTTPIFYAIKNNPSVIRLLTLYGDINSTISIRGCDMTTFEYAIDVDNPEAVRVLLENDVNWSIPGHEGIPPIFYAISKNKTEVISELVFLDDINKIVRIEGNTVTALDFVEMSELSEADKTKVRRMLISRGAKHAETVIAEARETRRRAETQRQTAEIVEARESATGNSTMAR